MSQNQVFNSLFVLLTQTVLLNDICAESVEPSRLCDDCGRSSGRGEHSNRLCTLCGDQGFVLTLLFTINQSYQLVVLLQLLVDVSLLHA